MKVIDIDDYQKCESCSEAVKCAGFLYCSIDRASEYCDQPVYDESED